MGRAGIELSGNALGNSSAAEKVVQGVVQLSPDLAKVIARWPALSPAQRQAILALVEQ